MSRYISSVHRKWYQPWHSVCSSTQRIDVARIWQRCNYSIWNIALMPQKTIEVTALPGPEFVDSDGKLIDCATVTEIFFAEKRRVFGGDAVLAIQKEAIVRNHLKRELSYVLSPVSGRILRYHVKVKDSIRIGQPLYDIDTMDDYETSHQAVLSPPQLPPKSIPQTKKMKLKYLPIPKAILQEYMLIQNEVDDLEDELKKLKRYASSPSAFAQLPIPTTGTPTLVNTTAPPALTDEISKLIYGKLEIYERILSLKIDAYQKAITTLVSPDMDEDVILQYQRLNDSDPLEIASTYRSMGLLYLRLKKYDDAHEYIKEAVLLRRKKNRCGDFQHFDLVQDVLVHLGIIKQKLDDPEGARRSLYEAFTLQTRYLGHSYHPIIANTVHLLGEVNYDLGKNENALKSYVVAKKVFNDIGTSLPIDQGIRNLPQIPSVDFEPATSIDELKIRYKIETAKVLHNASIVQEQMGQRTDAIDSAIQELRIRKSVLPPNDLSIATCHYMIGDLLVADGGQQKKDPPIRHYESAFAIYESNYGHSHKTVAMIYLSIGALHLMHKKYDEAYENYKMGLEILEVTEGKNNPDVASAYLYTGQALFEKGKDFYDDALEYFFLAYRSIENIEVPTKVENDPDDKIDSIQLILTTIIESIGNAYRERGKTDEAIHFYQEAVDLLILKFGKKRHDVARIYYILAQTLLDQRDFDQSLKMFTTAKEIFSSIHGNHHPETAACYYKIGLVLREDPSRTVEALKSLQDARDRWLKEFGADDPNVVEVEMHIGEMEREFDSGTV